MAGTRPHQLHQAADTGRAQIRYGTGIVVCLALCLAASPVRADTCAAILKAFEALAAVPGYSQMVRMPDMPPIQSIAIGDVLYVNPGDKWQKVTLKPGGRLGILKAVVPDAASLKDCAKAGADMIDGRSMTTYTYVPPALKGAESLAKPGVQTLWVGDSDGLPYKMTDTDIEMTISYSNITPPVQ
ncbi:hypothetical protein [Pannonibacter sp.]|uniref:hypothetical protein n=1 Tax=Pannonibacter sp. TaxID=1906786 RepID=UPI003F72E950